MARWHRDVASHEQDNALELLNRIGAGHMFTIQRLAKRGRLHPDPMVAALSVEWANSILSAKARYSPEESGLLRFFWSILIEVVTLGMWGDFRFQSALLERRSRRTARQIIQASENSGNEERSS